MTREQIFAICEGALVSAEKEYEWWTACDVTYNAMRISMIDYCKANGVAVRVDWEVVHSGQDEAVEKYTGVQLPHKHVVFKFTPHAVVRSLKIEMKIEI